MTIISSFYVINDKKPSVMTFDNNQIYTIIFIILFLSYKNYFVFYISIGIDDKKPIKKLEVIVSDDDNDFVFGNNRKSVDLELFKKINSILRDVVPSQSYVDSQQYKGKYVHTYVYAYYVYLYLYTHKHE
jgi:hypothetical protein